jgi:hypothetical protein
MPGPAWPWVCACNRAGLGAGRIKDGNPAKGLSRRHHHPPGGRTCPGQHGLGYVPMAGADGGMVGRAGAGDHDHRWNIRANKGLIFYFVVSSLS